MLAMKKVNFVFVFLFICVVHAFSQNTIEGTITSKEVPAFLLAGIALLVMYAAFQAIPHIKYLSSLLTSVSEALAIFIVPAVGILAVKAIWDIGKEV